MKTKKIEIIDIYDFDNLMGQLPFYADTCYDISVAVDGYVHNVYTRVTLTPSSNPKGWETVKVDFAAACAECSERWSWSSGFGYH